MQQKRRKAVMNVSLSPEVMELLAQEAARHDRSRSWVIEWAVKKVFDREVQPADRHSRWDLDGVPSRSRYRGPGHLEQTGYIPEGSSEERDSFDAVDEDELPVGMARNLKGLPE